MSPTSCQLLYLASYPSICQLMPALSSTPDVLDSSAFAIPTPLLDHTLRYLPCPSSTRPFVGTHPDAFGSSAFAIPSPLLSHALGHPSLCKHPPLAPALSAGRSRFLGFRYPLALFEPRPRMPALFGTQRFRRWQLFGGLPSGNTLPHGIVSVRGWF